MTQQTAWCSKHGLQAITYWNHGRPLNVAAGPLHVTGKLACGDVFAIVMSTTNYDALS